jgi:hypothetical protein
MFSNEESIFEEYVEKEFPPFVDKLLGKVGEKNQISVSEFKKAIMFTRLDKKDSDLLIKYLIKKGVIRKQGKSIYIL